MELLGHEISPSPADCRYGHFCEIDTMTIKILTDNMPPSSFEDTASASTPHDSSENSAYSAYPPELIGRIAEVMSRHRPISERCASCVIDCALDALRGDQVVQA